MVADEDGGQMNNKLDPEGRTFIKCLKALEQLRATDMEALCRVFSAIHNHYLPVFEKQKKETKAKIKELDIRKSVLLELQAKMDAGSTLAEAVNDALQPPPSATAAALEDDNG